MIEQEKEAAKAQAKEQKGKVDPKTWAKGWVKMGSMLVNTNEASGAMAEVLYQLHEDIKARLAKVTEAVKSFDELSNTVIPEAGLYYLQLRNGIPERIIVDSAQRRKDAFSYAADFQLV